ncbi:MAG TPA: ATP synthase F1 subunit epsilon [Ktedonobacterales bacterium]
MSQRPTLRVLVLTSQQRVFEGEAEQVNAPGGDGELTILPRHAPLLTTLNLGEMRIRVRGEDEGVFVAGGFLEVNDNVVTVLADDAERASDLDESKAEEARQRAQALVNAAEGGSEAHAEALAELERAVGRLRVAELHRIRSGGTRRRPAPPQPDYDQ